RGGEKRASSHITGNKRSGARRRTIHGAGLAKCSGAGNTRRCSFVSIGLLEYAHARAEHGGDITRHRRPWLRSSDLQLECRGGDDFLLFRLCTGCSIPHSSDGLHGSAGATRPRVSSRRRRDSTTTRAAELYVGSKASTISSNSRRDGSTRRNVGASSHSGHAPTVSRTGRRSKPAAAPS